MPPRKAAAPRTPPAKRPPPPPVNVSESYALKVMQNLISGGDMEAACASAGLVPVATVLLWAEAHPEWKTAFALAKALFAEHVAHTAMEIADEPVPWHEWAGMEVAEMRLRMEAHFRRQAARIQAAQAYASRIAPAQGGPAVSVNVDARRDSGDGFASTLAAVEAMSAKPVIDQTGAPVRRVR